MALRSVVLSPNLRNNHLSLVFVCVQACSMFKNTYSPVALTQFERSVDSPCSSKKMQAFLVGLFVKQGLTPHWLDLELSRWSRVTLNRQLPESCGYKLAPSLLFMRCWGSSPGLPSGKARTLLTELQQLPGPSLTIVETTNNAMLEDMGMGLIDSLPPSPVSPAPTTTQMKFGVVTTTADPPKSPCS